MAHTPIPQHRETTITIHGVSRTVRTPAGRTPASTETAHLKAVRDALRQLHAETEPAYARYLDTLDYRALDDLLETALNQSEYRAYTNRVSIDRYTPEIIRATHLRLWRKKLLDCRSRRTFNLPTSRWVSGAPFPKPRRLAEIPAHLAPYVGDGQPALW